MTSIPLIICIGNPQLTVRPTCAIDSQISNFWLPMILNLIWSTGVTLTMEVNLIEFAILWTVCRSQHFSIKSGMWQISIV